MARPSFDRRASLRRNLSLPLLVFYGLGTILGAGIYVLVGEVAGAAGHAAPLAFLGAGLVAGVTAFSYAELASRIPRSAGEAAYLRAAFPVRLPAMLAGWGVVLTGVVSAATIANGFAGYLREFVAVPVPVAVLASILLLGGLAAWGVETSVGAASAVTVIEIAGLVLVCGFGLIAAPSATPPEVATAATAGAGPLWHGVFLGGFLAFFAFIGFEDIVNMAEEVRDPARNLPRAILIAMSVATLLYILVAAIAVRAVPPGQLAGAEAPLVLVVGGGGGAGATIGVISMVAIINGALIQIIMVSRVLYGMAGQRLAPGWLRQVHPKRQTPLRATALATAAICALALSFDLTTLAKTTSSITLAVFAMVNLALLRIKSSPSATRAPFSVPRAVPATGLALCVVCLAAGLLGLG